MKTSEFTVSKALEEVREWKRQVHEETKDMTTAEVLAYYRRSTEEFAEEIGAEVVPGPNGTFRFVKKAHPDNSNAGPR